MNQLCYNIAGGNAHHKPHQNLGKKICGKVNSPWCSAVNSDATPKSLNWMYGGQFSKESWYADQGRKDYSHSEYYVAQAFCF